MHVDNIVKYLTGCCNQLQQIYFAGTQAEIPVLAFQVSFPRLEIVLSGSLADACLGDSVNILEQYDALYVPAKSWNNPVWMQPATTLNVLFGKQQVGFSVQQWDGVQLMTLCKINVSRRGPRIGSFLLQALNEIKIQPSGQKTARYIVGGLLSHCADLLVNPVVRVSRSRTLFDTIRDYIDENFRQPLTRETVAKKFYVSPNYLSHLFQKTGGAGFKQYLTAVRIEHAKNLLKSYNLTVKEVAHDSGFIDSNYFCRLFRDNTARTPSEYRQQYQSQPQYDDR